MDAVISCVYRHQQIWDSEDPQTCFAWDQKIGKWLHISVHASFEHETHFDSIENVFSHMYFLFRKRKMFQRTCLHLQLHSATPTQVHFPLRRFFSAIPRLKDQERTILNRASTTISDVKQNDQFLSEGDPLKDLLKNGNTSRDNTPSSTFKVIEESSNTKNNLDFPVTYRRTSPAVGAMVEFVEHGERSYGVVLKNISYKQIFVQKPIGKQFDINLVKHVEFLDPNIASQRQVLFEFPFILKETSESRTFQSESIQQPSSILTNAEYLATSVKSTIFHPTFKCSCKISFGLGTNIGTNVQDTSRQQSNQQWASWRHRRNSWLRSEL